MTSSTIAAAALNCWAAAGISYNLPVDLLYAVGQVESNHRVDAIGINKGGKSRDLGVMQINSTWLPTLKQFGITEHILLTQPCTNIQVGAWILSNEVARFGYSWQAIGAYNAGPITPKTSPAARERKLAIYRGYANKVLARWKKLAEKRASASAKKETVDARG